MYAVIYVRRKSLYAKATRCYTKEKATVPVYDLLLTFRGEATDTFMRVGPSA